MEKKKEGKREKRFAGRLREITKKFWNSLTLNKKRVLVFGGIVTLFLMISSISFTTLLNLSDNYISSSECRVMISSGVDYALQIHEESKWLALLYAFKIPVTWLLIAIGIGWIFHGVGFHIIKR